MRWLIVSIFVLVQVVLAGQIQAQTTGPAIAVIDVQKVVQNSEVGKKALAEIKTLKDRKQKEIDQKQSNIQQMQDKLEKQKDILSADAQSKLREDIERAVRDLRRFREDSEQEIQGKLGTALQSMEKRILPIIQKMGNDRGYSIIVSKDQLIYYNAKNDVTDEVIRLFNQEATKPATQQKQQ